MARQGDDGGGAGLGSDGTLHGSTAGDARSAAVDAGHGQADGLLVQRSPRALRRGAVGETRGAGRRASACLGADQLHSPCRLLHSEGLLCDKHEEGDWPQPSKEQTSLGNALESARTCSSISSGVMRGRASPASRRASNPAINRSLADSQARKLTTCKDTIRGWGPNRGSGPVFYSRAAES